MSSGRLRALILLSGLIFFLSNAYVAKSTDAENFAGIGEVESIDAKLAVNDLTVNSGQSFDVNVNIDFGTSEPTVYSGFQFDVIFPQYISFEDVTLSSELSDRFILTSKNTDKGIRIIAYSTNNSTTTLTNGIVTLKLRVSKNSNNKTGIIKLKNVYLSTPKGSDISLLDSDFTVDINIVAYSIELNPSNLTLLVGQRDRLTATVVPSNATDKTVIWSCGDSAIATVDDEGNVTALSPGTSTITATCGDASASCTVTVKGGTVEGGSGDSGITVKPGEGTEGGGEGDNGNLGEKTENGGYLNGNDLTLRVGQTATIEAELDPRLTTLPTLEWELATGGNKFVTLTPANNTLSAAFTGQAIGETAYTISIAGNKLVEGKVKVIAEKPIYALRLDPAAVILAQNALPVTITPEYTPGDVTVKTLEWSSSDITVASVDPNGEVTPLKQGVTTITATTTDGTGIRATSTVTVTAPIDVNFEFDFDESVMGGKEGISLYLGDTYKFTPKAKEGYVLPEVIEWSTSDEKIVSVSDEGLITALSLGKVTITATATVNGKEVKAQCEVTVIPNEPDQPDVPDVPVKRADTPTEMLRKGDGTSHTFVAMMEKRDEVLEAEGYRYVFGYSNAADGDVALEDTPWRYTHTTEMIYWNSSNDFWVFAYYVDNEGTLFVGSRRHLDGSVDDGFDPMDFIGSSSRSGEQIIGIYTVEGKFMGKNIEVLESGIYIIRTTQTSYKVIK